MEISIEDSSKTTLSFLVLTLPTIILILSKKSTVDEVVVDDFLPAQRRLHSEGNHRRIALDELRPL
jgi:hypothetical protein